MQNPKIIKLVRMMCTRKAFCAIVDDEGTHENSQVHYYKVMKFLHSRIMNIFAVPYYPKLTMSHLQKDFQQPT